MKASRILKTPNLRNASSKKKYINVSKAFKNQAPSITIPEISYIISMKASIILKPPALRALMLEITNPPPPFYILRSLHKRIFHIKDL